MSKGAFELHLTASRVAAGRVTTWVAAYVVLGLKLGTRLADDANTVAGLLASTTEQVSAVGFETAEIFMLKPTSAGPAGTGAVRG